MTDTRLWHGGAPGLKVGELLLPPSETGTEHSLTGHALADDVETGLMRSDLVYLTTDRASARAYAAAYPNGALYVAEPLGEQEPDPDAPEIAIRCPRARITAVYDPCVRWAERGERWLAPLLRGTR